MMLTDQTDAESYFARRVRDECGRSVYPVLTDPNAMRERIRLAINECKLADLTFGRRIDGAKETFRQAFERFYRQPLQPTTPEEEKIDGHTAV